MKKLCNLKSLSITIVFLFITVSINSQSYSISSSNQISNIKEFRTTFNLIRIYDDDFEKWGNKIYENVYLYINLNSEGKGDLKVMLGNDKNSFFVESCFSKRYSNDKDSEYWQFNCLTKEGMEKKVYLDFKNNNKNIHRFWFRAGDNKRWYAIKD